MRYSDKAIEFKERVYAAQGLEPAGDAWTSVRPIKWKDLDELRIYFESFGCRIKEDKRRRKGYLVVTLQKGIVAEAPMEFAEKVLAFGFP